jgi:hypothetical protein
MGHLRWISSRSLVARRPGNMLAAGTARPQQSLRKGPGGPPFFEGKFEEFFIAMKVFEDGPQDRVDAQAAIISGARSLDLTLLRRLAKCYGSAAGKTLEKRLADSRGPSGRPTSRRPSECSVSRPGPIELHAPPAPLPDGAGRRKQC